MKHQGFRDWRKAGDRKGRLVFVDVGGGGSHEISVHILRGEFVANLFVLLFGWRLFARGSYFPPNMRYGIVEKVKQ
jgi:hypothetical protein